MTDESGTSDYSYDQNNRLTEIKKNGADQISYAYDQIGNVTKVTDLKGYEVGYTYDKSSRMETVTYGGKTTTYSYDDNGRRSSVTYEGGVSENYTYDKDNRLIKLTNAKQNGGSISEYSYTYDLAGRQLTKTDLYGTTSYEYDKAGRISKVATSGKTTIYSYDKAGNRISQHETYISLQPSDYVDETTGKEIQYILKKSDYTYSNTNQLLKLVERMFDESNKEIARKTTKYTYDNNGNQLNQSISHTLPDNTGLRPKTTGTAYGDKLSDNSNSIDKLLEKTSYTYDGFNRLVKTETIKDGIRTTVDFIYNGDDLRVSKTTRKSNNNYSPEVTNYLYDRQNVILETDANSNIKARYIKGINYIAKADSTGKETYFLFNGHGDVVQTVDEAGTVQNRYEYDIWGNPTLTIETTSNAIRYTGEFYDEETGLYYLRARYYDPYLGRFTTEDSYWGEDDNPLSLNLYTYCMNDPIQYVDPSGHVLMYVTMVGIIQDVDPSDVDWWLNEGCEFVTPDDVYWGAVYVNANVDKIKTADGMNTKVVTSTNSSVNTVETGKDSNTTISNRGNITNINTGEKSNTTINNRGFIDTINTGKESSLVLNNYGTINNEVRLGEHGTADIYNHKNAFIMKILGGDTDKNSNKGMHIKNRGTINYVLTGKNSSNDIDNEGGYLILETGEGNKTVVIAGQKGVTHRKGNGRTYIRLYNVFTGEPNDIEYKDTKEFEMQIEQLLKNNWSLEKPAWLIKEEKLKDDIDDYYQYALEYYNDPENNWFIPYRKGVKELWEFIDRVAKEYNLDEYEVRLLKADAVFYSGNTIEEMSAEYHIKNSPKEGLEGFALTTLTTKLSSNKSALGTRTNIEKFKGFRFKNEGTNKTIKTNQGNEIDITPSSNHSTTTKNPGLGGKANSSVDILDSNGNIITRRWYGPDGKQIRDVDFTNHGNPTNHPEWPHEHGPRR